MQNFLLDESSTYCYWKLQIEGSLIVRILCCTMPIRVLHRPPSVMTLPERDQLLSCHITDMASCRFSPPQGRAQWKKFDIIENQHEPFGQFLITYRMKNILKSLRVGWGGWNLCCCSGRIPLKRLIQGIVQSLLIVTRNRVMYRNFSAALRTLHPVVDLSDSVDVRQTEN